MSKITVEHIVAVQKAASAISFWAAYGDVSKNAKKELVRVKAKLNELETILVGQRSKENGNNK